MSKPKVWTLPALLDRIWMLSRGKRTAVETTELRTSGPLAGTGGRIAHRVVTAYDEDYKDRTYHLNKIGAPVAAALYERIKTMRAAEQSDKKAAWGQGWQAGYNARELVGFKMPDELALELSRRLPEPVRPPADPYKKQLDERSGEVQRWGGL